MIQKSGKGTLIVLLVIAFLVIVLIGRFYFSPHPIDHTGDVYSPPSEVGTDTTPISGTNASQNGAIKNQANSDTENEVSSCVDKLRTDVATKKQSYAKGQILVTFNSDQVYKNVKDVLAVYGLVVQNEVESQSSFANLHLITAAVAPGQEIPKVCLLRSDAHIKYAGLDLYFNLHE